MDNGSSDSSGDGLERFDFPLEIIHNHLNRGFAHACNQGADLCDARYLLFLNPDAALFENSLTVPLAFMDDEANQDVGICGIQLVDEKGRVTSTCARFPSLSRFIVHALGLNRIPRLKGGGVHMNDWDHLSDRSVDHVIGAFFFVRRDVFEEINGFDERFFVYLEDVDFSLRAKKAGWETIYLTGAQSFHKGGGTSERVKATRLFYSLRSRLLYGFKYFPRWQAWALFGITMFVEPVARLVFCGARGQWGGMIDTLRGYRMLWEGLAEVAHSRGKGKE
ncbi:MAG TPA: glycosyltransferase family 2 protein [Chromatiaceae bacterium]|nr:glycosyltransferase family 2 protein [Chromatiaceae bacterium]